MSAQRDDILINNFTNLFQLPLVGDVFEMIPVLKTVKKTHNLSTFVRYLWQTRQQQWIFDPVCVKKGAIFSNLGCFVVSRITLSAIHTRLFFIKCALFCYSV